MLVERAQVDPNSKNTPSPETTPLCVVQTSAVVMRTLEQYYPSSKRYKNRLQKSIESQVPIWKVLYRVKNGCWKNICKSFFLFAYVGFTEFNLK